jgi:cell pole-organizing protein PopZ
MSNETPKEGAAGDPSMEEILSSIRRILNEDEAQAGAKPPPSPEEDGVLVLDPTMLVKDGEAAAPTEPKPAEPEPVAAVPPPVEAPAMDAAPAAVDMESPLLANDTAESAAASILGLVRTLATDRLTPVYRAGPTIEDLVREEIRPLLKTWLDAHLPALVERLVRNEIERVVNRAVP